MKKSYIYSSMLLIAFISITLTSCETSSIYEDELSSISGIAVANPDFSTLEAAAVYGNVAGVLSNANPNDPSGDYTVFAPNDAAFARLGLTESTIGVLQQGFLTNDLLYHVSNGNLRGADIIDGSTSSSALQGLTRRFVERDGSLFVNGSRILATDIEAENGTIHVIDKVMIATGGNVVESAIALQSAQVFQTSELSYLVEAVLYAELAEALSNPDANFTVFAPNDQAFIDLGTALGLTFTEPADIRQLDKDLVTAVLLNHVFADVSADKFTSELNAGSFDALGDDDITLGEYTNGVLTVSGSGNDSPANMVIPDVQTTNGVVHVIDQVLLPIL
ncbi:fasciclin domain-containing protein [Dokdonia sp. Hel_I_53]|uniref:fasciclin domain-containing protein n=1 Tax=Dokdonia sp. Hel_I_53 TaxID=1566287 RepID=UPI00119912DF|nr:fasciclin domain-containing protein [Dokdonia sp. Hel_I_53]TVZ51986.1 putative surface protein with fasciclin (FAS1) repeats [Dokdonia sp. Hel_I_53]